DRVVQPPLDQVELDLATLEPQLVALEGRVVLHPRDDRAALGTARQDPRGERELVEVPEGARVAGVEEPNAVEVGRAADLSGREGRLAAAEERRPRAGASVHGTVQREAGREASRDAAVLGVSRL